MNLPKYVAAIENAHSEFRLDVANIVENYQTGMTRAAGKLEETLDDLKNEFFATEDVPMEINVKPRHDRHAE